MRSEREELSHECECEEVHAELVRLKREELPDEESVSRLSDLFKVFGDATRLNILFALAHGPMCGCDLAAALGITKAAISYQLKMLRGHDLVRYKKEGKNVIYRLSDDHVKSIIECAIEHINE
ncbi:MAG: winged helix-turn-helix transcriptional regulator [Clostridia bacterium]|nr:winged helix-turn-helix transcriptional regulator [Clostridia bacterium]